MSNNSGNSYDNVKGSEEEGGYKRHETPLVNRQLPMLIRNADVME